VYTQVKENLKTDLKKKEAKNIHSKKIYDQIILL